MRRPPSGRLPSWVTQVSRTISSSKSRTQLAVLDEQCRGSSTTLREYIWLAWNGIVAGQVRLADDRDAVAHDRLAGLGQRAVAARSRRRGRRSPSRAASRRTASSVRRSGAGLPGISAVVMTASDSAGVEREQLLLALVLVLGERDRVAAAPSAPSTSSSRNFAPRLSTCSFTAGRTSYAETTAPSRRAVAIAWSPATPAPSTSTFAGADRAGRGREHREELADGARRRAARPCSRRPSPARRARPSAARA